MEPQQPTLGSPSAGAGVAERAHEVVSATTDSARQVASTAAEGVKDVTSTVADKAAELKEEAMSQGRNLLDESRSQFRQQVRQQTDSAAGGLRRLSSEIRALGEGRPEEAGQVRDYVRQAADAVERVAGQLQGRGLEGVVSDVERFARRRPGVFLLGAAAAGFAVGRMVSAARAGSSGDGGQSTGTGYWSARSALGPSTSPSTGYPSSYPAEAAEPFLDATEPHTPVPGPPVEGVGYDAGTNPGDGVVGNDSHFTGVSPTAGGDYGAAGR